MGMESSAARRAGSDGVDGVGVSSAELAGGGCQALPLDVRCSVFVAVVDYDAAEVGDGFDEDLETVVPLGGGLEDEHDALVGEAELEVADFADVVDEVLGVVELGADVGVRSPGKDWSRSWSSRMAMSDFSRTTSLMVTKGAPAALACSTKSFQPSGFSSSKMTVGTSSVT